MPTGTQIRSVANITFDSNPAIATDQVSDTDPTPGTAPTKEGPNHDRQHKPTSSVTALPATERSTSFTLSWSGSDGTGSGIATYDVLYSDNGGAYQTFLVNTNQTSATFTGQSWPHLYVLQCGHQRRRDLTADSDGSSGDNQDRAVAMITRMPSNHAQLK